jgi:membrane protease subunit (stomatin/prohibitin family)
MPIDFSNPGDLTHQGTPIPINTQDKFDATEAMMQAFYTYYGIEWSPDDAQQLEQRVRNGKDLYEVQRAFGQDLQKRHNVTL